MIAIGIIFTPNH